MSVRLAEDSSMKIYIEPIGGLCNRMRVIASAFESMKSSGGKIVVNWVATDELNCPMKALFTVSTTPPDCIILEQTDSSSIGRLLMKAAYYYFRIVCRNRLDDNTVLQAKANGDILLEDRTYYQTCETFQKDARGLDFSIFTPNPVLYRKAQSKISRISENGKYRVVGVHIRRTDHGVSIQDSPTELFFRLLDASISKDDSVRFYIATDDMSVRESFDRKYNAGRAVVFFNDSKELSRNTAEGIKAAYVELLTLSLTERIYGSSGSSYSETAAALRKISMEKVTANTIEEIIRSIDSQH